MCCLLGAAFSKTLQERLAGLQEDAGRKRVQKTDALGVGKVT